jgi:hypothetical protein
MYWAMASLPFSSPLSILTPLSTLNPECFHPISFWINSSEILLTLLSDPMPHEMKRIAEMAGF